VPLALCAGLREETLDVGGVGGHGRKYTAIATGRGIRLIMTRGIVSNW
jgi:hypothetical protein